MSRTQGVADRSEGAPGAPAARTWHFGTALLDERKLELTVGGQVAELDRKAVEVLRHFLRHAGEVVTKDELLAAVWPGRILSDSALTSCVARLREALQDQAQDIIKTVHGYGYRLVAQVRITNHHVAPAARFDFKPGDHPPGRPLWSLLRRLGAGGHGEAWLGAHDKTREQRVFKFAKDESSLGALKREITLFRLLHDSLGERARIVELLDWNLELQPYFVESRYIAGGSLLDLAERHGKLSAIPLATRLDVAAQIADALAAVHGVGVLHKDLKPSNVLVEEIAGGTPKVRLADFGSGGLLDAERLEAMGITRAGFTHTLKLNEAEGTLLYLAPEIVAGQIPTVKADIYALGVMLYQLVLGDFRTALSPGWERSIEDELLRECIADAAVGEPDMRLADAAALAQRLRTLDQSREQRRREREAKAKAEAAARALERLRARRVGLIAAGVAMVAGTVTSTALYLDARKSRDEAMAAADFLSKDLFAQAESKPLKDLTVLELLQTASQSIAGRSDLPAAAAARLHAALGSAFWTMERPAEAQPHLRRALDYYTSLGNEESQVAATDIAGQLLMVEFVLGQLPAELTAYEEVLAASMRTLPTGHQSAVGLRKSIARMRLLQGDWPRAHRESAQLLAESKVAGADVASVGEAAFQLGSVLWRMGEFATSEDVFSESIANAELGASQQLTAEVRVARACVLIELERFDEAESELSRARDLAQDWSLDAQGLRLAAVELGFGQLRVRQDRDNEAIRELTSALNRVTASIYNRTLDHTGEIRFWLATAYQQAGRLDDAVAEMQRAASASAATLGRAHPITQRMRVGLADVYRAQRRTAAAQEILLSVNEAALTRLGADHQYLAELRRVEGLSALAARQATVAQAALMEARRIFEIRYGKAHAFSRRARDELAQLSMQRTSAE